MGGSFVHKVYAFSVSPMSVSLEPQGQGASHSFLIDNNGGPQIPVQVTLAQRDPDLEGNEKMPEVNGLFLIYPAQFVLGANEKRTIRLTWNGTHTPTEEQAFRLIVEQLPVELKKSETKKGAVIKMLLRYIAAIYVTPKNANSKLVVSQAQFRFVGKLTQLELVLENQGNAHQIIKHASLKLLSKTGQSYRFPDALLMPLDGQNVLNGKKRRFLLPWPKGFPKKDFRAEFGTSSG